MADGCFLCSCRIFRASIARRYRSGGGRESGTDQRLSLAAWPCAHGLPGCILPEGSNHSTHLPSILPCLYLCPLTRRYMPKCSQAAQNLLPTEWDPLMLLGKVNPGKYQPKVLETSSCCCSMTGSCDLILFLIFFFFFFFMPCAG